MNISKISYIPVFVNKQNLNLYAKDYNDNVKKNF